MEDDSKEYCWKWVTANSLLSHVPVEVCLVILTSKAEASAATIYNGESTTGEILVTLESLASRSTPFGFHHHPYLNKGLYVAIDENTLGVLVVWKERPQGASY